ncbi:IQ domain-containing protein IQM3-like [Citrus sinensis]|uniref:IQ domain-containing protein IQM3-like n=1 Tax=Citrus sinensis TaxID=2711 RepID=UPI0022776DA9|nr:IQ domain-containing protein IQM3-like [Citrus sinensis]
MAPSVDHNDNGFIVMDSKESNGGYKSSVAAMKLQKVYRSYCTQHRLADSVVVAEELWWQAIDYARLNHSTVSFFNFDKPETAASRWARISLNASKVGKGLSTNAKAQKLAFQHWIEAIDPRHRYGHNLNLYYEEWCKRDTEHPFSTVRHNAVHCIPPLSALSNWQMLTHVKLWIRDSKTLGDGKEVDLKDCPRLRLQQECIKYLGPLQFNQVSNFLLPVLNKQGRERYQYIIVEGILVNKQTGTLLSTNHGSEGSKWIFVMSASKKLYAGEKRKGSFHHSSFLAGGATLAAGRLMAEGGKLMSVSAYSGHYRPSNENLDNFLAFLKENGVDAGKVQVISVTEDNESCGISKSAQERRKFRELEDPEPPKSKVPRAIRKPTL